MADMSQAMTRVDDLLDQAVLILVREGYPPGEAAIEVMERVHTATPRVRATLAAEREERHEREGRR